MARTISRKMSYADQMANAESNVEKLPKWAQEYVAALKRRGDNAIRELDQIKNPPGDSNVFRLWGLSPDDEALGKGAHIRFRVLDQKFNNSINVRITGGGLEINGDDGLVVMPSSSNHIRIELMER